ncbi:hypothetical protein BX600DRAFT_512912 [Xylariales sp. PMI_506]|nr:hypothetical protein BX600DRAFT_512912 [Xylariales sp. PMI_506]
MNFQGINNGIAKKNQSTQFQATSPGSETPATTATAGASQITVIHDPFPQPVKEGFRDSTPPTVIPYVPSAPSTPDIYGPERLFPHELQEQQPNGYGAGALVSSHSLVPYSAPPQLPMAGALEPASDFRDELVRSVGSSVTPGVDDTPYIQYALGVLTRPPEPGREISAIQSSSSEETNPTQRYLPGIVPGLFQPPPIYLGSASHGLPLSQDVGPSPEEELAALRRQRRADAMSEEEAPGYVVPDATSLPESRGSIGPTYSPDTFEDWDQSHHPQQPETIPALPVPGSERAPREAHYWQAQPDRFADPEKASRYPPLNYRPWILGDLSLLLFGILNILMITALVFCAVYSSRHGGLNPYGGTIYDGTYFIFRVLPQLLAAVILLWSQSVIMAVFRVLPFSAMASDDLASRRNVGFLPLYPKSFLWPQLVSTWHVWVPIVVNWILNMTIPLQSCLFTVVYVNNIWMWSTVQGVAWILVALYASSLLSTILLFICWHNQQTGLFQGWDVRSLADIIALLNQSNSLQQYVGTDTAARRNDMRHMLYSNVERLGYWSAPEMPMTGLWYGIGVPTNVEKVDVETVGPPVHERGPKELRLDGSVNRGRYLPWCFRNTQIILWVVATSVLLIALVAICFNPATDIRNGFLPLVGVGPVQGAFSAADFLYSFLPSLIGLIIFLLFQSLDITLRILMPWGELSRKDGASASKSILVDYAASLPFESTWKALKNRHWRVAFVSLISILLLLLPILAGGMFMALTPPSGVVRTYPNIAILGVILSLLILMLLGLISLIPQRDQLRLPHAVTCLSEIISFCYADELRTDNAFYLVHGRQQLKDQLGAWLGGEDQSRWCFGPINGSEGHVGIKRYVRYTGDSNPLLAAEKHARALRDQAGRALKRKHSISRPVPQGNSTMIGP